MIILKEAVEEVQRKQEKQTMRETYLYFSLKKQKWKMKVTSDLYRLGPFFPDRSILNKE